MLSSSQRRREGRADMAFPRYLKKTRPHIHDRREKRSRHALGKPASAREHCASSILPSCRTRTLRVMLAIGDGQVVSVKRAPGQSDI